MNKLTEVLLQKIFPFADKQKIERYLPHLNDCMELYEIDTPCRQAAFLAIAGYESGQLYYAEDCASGKTPENRLDLGNVYRGDGERFKGRGLIRIVGRSRYTALSSALGIDFLANPHLLAEPDFAVLAACWLWNDLNLNVQADYPTDNNFVLLCRIACRKNIDFREKYISWRRNLQLLTA